MERPQIEISFQSRGIANRRINPVRYVCYSIENGKEQRRNRRSWRFRLAKLSVNSEAYLHHNLIVFDCAVLDMAPDLVDFEPIEISHGL